VRPSESGLPRDVNPHPRPTQCVERPGERHRVLWQRDDVGPDDDVIHASVVGLDAHRSTWHETIASTDDDDVPKLRLTFERNRSCN
jgi:hypothetical protein